MDEAFSALDPLIRSQMQDAAHGAAGPAQEDHRLHHPRPRRGAPPRRPHRHPQGRANFQIGTPAEILLNPADDYVRAFVKDVNRARVLTVDAVMKPPPLRLTDETLEQALAAMQRRGAEIGYVVNDRGYLGIVTRDAVNAAIASHAAPSVELLAVDAPSIDAGSSIAEALPATLSSEFPVAVIDADGALAGIISADRVGEVLTPPAEKEAAE